ncbi:Protein MALE DISCOVERER 1 [Linum perenne]
MEGRWNPIGTKLLCFLVFIVGVEIHGSQSFDDEGFILLQFRSKVRSDPYGVLANWNLCNSEPCAWFGVHCIAGKVHVLNLSGCSLEGTLSPELGNLSHLRSLILRNNLFSGILPKQIGRLKMLEVLDVRDNDLSGKIPTEIERLQPLKCLLVSGNKFEGSIPEEMRRIKLLSPLKLDRNIAYTSCNGFDYANKEFENEFYLRDASPQPHKGSCYSHEHEIYVNFAHRKLQEQPEILSNLIAENASYDGMMLPSSLDIFFAVPVITRGSGAFPAITNSSSLLAPSPTNDDDGLRDGANATSDDSPKGPIIHNGSPHELDTWIYFFIALMVALFLATMIVMVIMCRKRGVVAIGLSGQLQKAFTSGGVPKLNRMELETACEEFSNIIHSYDGATMYKGTLSSGVEIAVTITTITSRKIWSRNAEKAYRKKIDTLSKINHKNFVNLIGFCEEDEPFNRMMVFEYAPNGTLFEHIHVKGMEHLDWSSRVRIIMGVAYCLQYMHHELPTPVPHSNLTSHSIYLTDDYAAKIAEVSFMSQAASKAKPAGENESEHSELPPPSGDPQTNVYSFGVLLLEIVSGKLPNSEKDGPIEKWAAGYFSEKNKLEKMVDQSLKSFKSNELEVICEIAQECTIQDPKQRPSMNLIIPRLREVINVRPDQAVPRLSPLWWAELEILEAS